jgi:hypothetical protein
MNKMIWTKMMNKMKKNKKKNKGLEVSLKKDLETLQNQKLEAY